MNSLNSDTINALEERYKSLFVAAGFKIHEEHQLMNQYWPRCDVYTKFIMENPWYLFKTQFGYIKVGRRKNVFSLSWESTGLRKIITEDDVTKEKDLVHAWSWEDLSKYLFSLHQALVLYDEEKIRDEIIGLLLSS